MSKHLTSIPEEIVIPLSPQTHKTYVFIFLKNRGLHYKVRRTKRKSILLSVNQHGLEVSAPFFSSNRDIQEAIRQKSEWILKKIAYYDQKKSNTSFSPISKTILYKGQSLRLWESDEVDKPHLSDGVLFIPDSQHPNTIQALLDDWLEQHALTYFAERLVYFSSLIGIEPHSWGLSSSCSSWGSCNGKARILLNRKLIAFPEKIIDYVIVHELIHLKEMNHSAHFWAQVAQYCPYYKAAKQWLSEYDPNTL